MLLYVENNCKKCDFFKGRCSIFDKWFRKLGHLFSKYFLYWQETRSDVFKLLFSTLYFKLLCPFYIPNY